MERVVAIIDNHFQFNKDITDTVSEIISLFNKHGIHLDLIRDMNHPNVFLDFQENNELKFNCKDIFTIYVSRYFISIYIEVKWFLFYRGRIDSNILRELYTIINFLEGSIVLFANQTSELNHKYILPGDVKLNVGELLEIIANEKYTTEDFIIGYESDNVDVLIDYNPKDTYLQLG